MKIPFNSMGVKCRAEFSGNKIFVSDNVQFRIRCIQPCRDMPPGNKMDFPYPRCILLNSTEPIMQIIPIPITFLSVIHTEISFLYSGVFLFFLPCRIISINPSNNKIYPLIFILCFHNYSPCSHFRVKYNTSFYYVTNKKEKRRNPLITDTFCNEGICYFIIFSLHVHPSKCSHFCRLFLR